jgi:hypothetical protein
LQWVHASAVKTRIAKLLAFPSTSVQLHGQPCKGWFTCQTLQGIAQSATHRAVHFSLCLLHEHAQISAIWVVETKNQKEKNTKSEKEDKKFVHSTSPRALLVQQLRPQPPNILYAPAASSKLHTLVATCHPSRMWVYTQTQELAGGLDTLFILLLLSMYYLDWYYLSHTWVKSSSRS